MKVNTSNKFISTSLGVIENWAVKTTEFFGIGVKNCELCNKETKFLFEHTDEKKYCTSCI
jgi:hypothetical protein